MNNNVSYIRDENMAATGKKMSFEVVYMRHCNCDIICKFRQLCPVRKNQQKKLHGFLTFWGFVVYAS